MLTSVKIWKAGLAQSVILNEITPTVKFPIHDFTWSQPTRGDALPKMESPGQHDRYSDIDAMALNMEGDIVGSTTTEYWTNRKELLACVVPAKEHVYRYHSHIQIKIDGDSETYWCNVTLEEWEAPMRALYPTVTEFQFQWSNPYGYWRKLSDNSVAII